MRRSAFKMHCLTCPVMRFHYTALNASTCFMLPSPRGLSSGTSWLMASTATMQIWLVLQQAEGVLAASCGSHRR